MAEAEPVELGAGAFLDVPVVADRGEMLLAGVAGGEGVSASMTGATPSTSATVRSPASGSVCGR